MKKYIHSGLSILVIIAFVALVVKMFYSETSDNWVTIIPYILITTIAIGAVGGAILLFVRMIRKTKLQYSFVYNLFGTVAMIAGFAGLASTTGKTDEPMYLATASFVVGLFIYSDIYFRHKS